MYRANSILIVLASLLVACAPAETVSVRVIDGDTVDAGLDNNVRLTLDDGSGFDTPETFRPDCAKEARLGQAASNRLREIVRNANNVDLQVGSKSCGYGRYCGALRVDGTNVGNTLIREGLAKRSKNYDWCGAT